MEKILTISVAAYNLGKMIEDNLKSFVCLKNIEDIEILIIDDGSKDNTVQIAEKYQRKFPKSIRVIKQKNAGPGSTVNTGLKNAKGKYFKTIDGDDWIKSQDMDKLLEELKKTEKVDAIITNDLVYSEKDREIIKKIKFPYENGKVFENLKIERPIIGMHSIAFRTSILKENNIILDNGFYTDVEYLLYPIPFVKNIIYFDLDVYVYRVGRIGQSVSYKSLKRNINMHNLIVNNIMKYYEEKKNDMSKENAMFMRIRIADMVETKISLILAFEKLTMVKRKCKAFLEDLKEKYFDIYSICAKKSKIKYLLISNYYLSVIYAIYLKYKVSKEK